MTNATERMPDRLEAGREYIRNVTVAIPIPQVETIGSQAMAIREALEKTYTGEGHEVLGYELVVRVFVRGGETDEGHDTA